MELNIKISLKRIIKFINEYLNLIIITPAVLGGLWQLIELLRISPSFIRFFSVTQIVADGLLVLFILLIAFSITFVIIKGYVENERKTIDEKEITPSSKKVVLYFILYLITVWIIILINKFIQSHVIILVRILIFLPMNLFLVVLSILFIFKISKFSTPKEEENNKRLEFAYSSLIIMIQVAIFWSFLRDMHNEFYLPKKLQNIEYIKCKLKITNPNQHIQLLYFNDKYIFVETKKSEIRILKFDEFLNDEICQ